MFGYVIINKEELKFKEYDVYHSYYCGLCRTLKEQYGSLGQISLNYDMTFLVMLLTGVYEPDTKEELHRCKMHPVSKRQMRTNVFSEYASKMTVVLTYYKCLDDWKDDRSYSRKGYAKLLKKKFNKIKEEYPKKVQVIEENLEKIHDYETNGNYTIDDISRCFGLVMAEICAYQEDIWYDELYQLGFYLGKFIYLIDAYEDIESDIKKNTFNPFKEKFQEKSFEEYSYSLLEMMVAEATLYFEKLPIIENVSILRNILYSGIWSKYVLVKNKRGGKI